MRRYTSYFWYVVRHKWFVALECWKRGLFWRGLVHDWHKFLPSEFVPYARFFHESDGSPKVRRDSTGYYKPESTGDYSFDWAWFLHTRRSKHHWQGWVLPTSGTGDKG